MSTDPEVLEHMERQSNALERIAAVVTDPSAAVIRNAVSAASTRAIDEHTKWKNARYQRISELAGAALTTDGAHHKQWFLEEIYRALGLDPDLFDHPRGIAP